MRTQNTRDFRFSYAPGVANHPERNYITEQVRRALNVYPEVSVIMAGRGLDVTAPPPEDGSWAAATEGHTLQLRSDTELNIVGKLRRRPTGQVVVHLERLPDGAAFPTGAAEMAAFGRETNSRGYPKDYGPGDDQGDE